MRHLPLEKLQRVRRKRRTDRAFYTGMIVFIAGNVLYALGCFGHVLFFGH